MLSSHIITIEKEYSLNPCVIIVLYQKQEIILKIEVRGNAERNFPLIPEQERSLSN